MSRRATSAEPSLLSATLPAPAPAPPVATPRTPPPPPKPVAPPPFVLPPGARLHQKADSWWYLTPRGGRCFRSLDEARAFLENGTSP